MKEVVIASGVRTPIGGFGSTLKEVPPCDLAQIVMGEAMTRASVQPGWVDKVIFGNCFAPLENNICLNNRNQIYSCVF